MRTFAIVATWVCALAMAQTPPPKKPIAPVRSGNAPVTASEAALVFAKADKILVALLDLKSKPAAFGSGSAPASRESILRRFNAMVVILRPKFKLTAPPQLTEPELISFKADSDRKLALRLEVQGFLDPYGPLVTSKGAGLSPREFGDALGYFFSRVADLTHTPSRKFSPFLMPP